MPLDRKYIIQLRTIITKLGMSEEDKEDAVLNTTQGRTKSIREMYPSEAITLINALNGKEDRPHESGKKSRMKRQILALCHEMGWEHDNGKVDLDRVNAYCKQRGYLKKEFNDYTEKELPRLVAQFRQMHKNYLLKNANSTV